MFLTRHEVETVEAQTHGVEFIPEGRGALATFVESVHPVEPLLPDGGQAGSSGGRRKPVAVRR